MVHDDTRANELTAKLLEDNGIHIIPDSPLRVSESAPLRVSEAERNVARVELGTQGNRVVLMVGEAGVVLAAEQALALANGIRLKANAILNLEHKMAARLRREKRRG